MEGNFYETTEIYKYVDHAEYSFPYGARSRGSYSNDNSYLICSIWLPAPFIAAAQANSIEFMLSIYNESVIVGFNKNDSTFLNVETCARAFVSTRSSMLGPHNMRKRYRFCVPTALARARIIPKIGSSMMMIVQFISYIHKQNILNIFRLFSDWFCPISELLRNRTLDFLSKTLPVLKADDTLPKVTQILSDDPVDVVENNG